MATEETVKLNFIADLAGLRKELAKLPDVGDKEAKKLVGKLDKQWKRAEKAAKKAAKGTKKATSSIKDGLESAKQAAEGFGGKIGGAAGMVEKFTKSALAGSSAAGPLAAAFGLGALAAVGYGAAIFYASSQVVGLIAEAEELQAKLEPFNEAGVFEPLAPETVASVERFNDSLAGIGIVADNLKVQLGGEFAESLETVARITLKASLIAGDLFNTYASGEGILRGVAQLFGVNAVVIEAASFALGKLDGATGDYDQRVEDLVGTLRAQKDEEKDSKKNAEALAKAKQRQAQAQREHTTAVRDAIKAAKDQAGAQKKLADLTAESTSDTLSASAVIERAYENRIEKIAEEAAAAKDAAGVQEAIAAADARRTRDLMGLDAERSAAHAKFIDEWEQREAGAAERAAEKWRSMRDGAIASAEAIAGHLGGSIETLANLRIDSIQGTFEQEQAHIEKRSAQYRKAEERRIAGMLATGRITEAQAQAQLKSIDKHEKAEQKKIQKLESIAEAAALKSLKRTKAVQKVQAAVDAARAAVALIPAYAFLGPAAPGAAAATAALGLATQIAVINSQEAPSFESGGSVSGRSMGRGSSNDHVVIEAQPDEGIVTGRGMSNVGKEGLNAINSGGGLGGLTIKLMMDGALVAQAVLDSPVLLAALGDEISAQLNLVAGQAPVYGRG